MAITAVSSPGAYTVGNTSPSTFKTVTCTINGTVSGHFYSARLYGGGNTASRSFPIGDYSEGTAGGSSLTLYITVSNSDILAGIDGCSLNWFIYVTEHLNSSSATVSSALSSSTAALTLSPRHTATSVSSYNLDVGGSLSTTSTEPSSHPGWRTRFQIWVNGTYIFQRSNYTSGNMTYTPSASETTAMLNAMGGVSPRTIQVRTFTGWNIGTSDNWYATSSYISDTDNITKTFVTVPSKNVGDNYAFSNYTSSYFYLHVTSSAPQSNGTYNITADVYVYAGQAITSKTITTLTCTIGGVAGTRTINSNTVNILQGVAQKVESFTATVGPFTTRSPQVDLVTTLNITDVGNNGPRTATTAAGFMPSIPALDAGNIVIHAVANGTPSILDDLHKQITTGEISANSHAFYKVRITDSTNGTTFANARDSAFGTSTLEYTWTARLPYQLYYYRFEIIGRDNASYGNKVVQQRANDDYPVINNFVMNSKTQTTVNVSVSVTSNSPISYKYFRKLSANPTFTEVATTTSSSHSYSGLTENTSYDFKVEVTNGDGSMVSSGTAGNAANLTWIVTASSAPVINSYTTTRTDTTIRFDVSAAVSSGLTATYSYGRRTGTSTWTWTAYIADANYTWTGLTSGTVYDFQLKVQDSVGTIVTSGVITLATLFAKPVISTLTATNISNVMATLKITAQNNQTTAISLYRFAYYAGTTLPTAWTTGNPYEVDDVVYYMHNGYKCLIAHTATASFTADYSTNNYWVQLPWVDRTSDSYLIAGLTSNTDYVILARVVDNQNPALSSNLVMSQFKTITVSPLASVSRAKFVRTSYASLATLPIRDGTFIVVTDTGDIYLDVSNDTRKLISYGIKIYDAVRDAGSTYTITTNDFDNLDLSSNRSITFYMKPDQTSLSATPSLTLNGTTLDLTGLGIYKTDGTQMAITGNVLYLVTFNNSGVTPAFILVNY